MLLSAVGKTCQSSDRISLCSCTWKKSVALGLEQSCEFNGSPPHECELAFEVQSGRARATWAVHKMILQLTTGLN